MLATNDTYNSQMLRIVQQYLNQGGSEPIDLEELARFAINKGLYQKRGRELILICKRDFSRAFREQYFTDPQGRAVRTFHAVKESRGEKQKVFWADLRTATEEHMDNAFQQRRKLIVGECRQLKKDVESYNNNNSHGGHFQLMLDFNDDVAEGEQPTTYRPRKTK